MFMCRNPDVFLSFFTQLRASLSYRYLCQFLCLSDARPPNSCKAFRLLLVFCSRRKLVCIVGIHRYRFVHCSLSYGKLLTLLLSSYTITCPRTMQILHTKHPPTVPPGLYREQAFGNLEKSSKQAADDVRVVNAQLMTCTHRDTVVERSPSCKC
jgi:hypothetical protein